MDVCLLRNTEYRADSEKHLLNSLRLKAQRIPGYSMLIIVFKAFLMLVKTISRKKMVGETLAAKNSGNIERHVSIHISNYVFLEIFSFKMYEREEHGTYHIDSRI